MTRMANYKIAYRILMRKPDEERLLGRTRCRFENNIKMDLVISGIPITTAWHGASSGCGWSNGLQIWRIAANIEYESADRRQRVVLQLGNLARC